MTLADLGFSPWFAAHAAGLGLEDCGLARVSAVDRGSYLIRNAAGEVPAELSGRLLHQVDSPVDLPCVGDWVTAHYYNDDSAALIHQVLPRRTFLRRRSSGDSIDYQLIAANIDTAFVVQSCQVDFNPKRLDRYLVMAADGQVDPVVLLTKTDLISPEELAEKMALVDSITRARVIALSTLTGTGLDELRQTLTLGRTYCLLGSSGVGKTTLINRLLGQDLLATRTVSGTGEGTHTTTRRQLIVLDQGAMLIDTPGMRELGLLGASQGLSTGFDQIVALADACRYANCRHEHEAGCAVRAAIERGELSADRFASYLKLKKESDFAEMSYLDRRKKDKAFGKFIKSVKKGMKG